MSNPYDICLEPKCEDTPPEPNLPNTYTQLKGFLSSAKKVVGDAFAGEGVFVDEHTYAHRMSICDGCEFFRKSDLRCSQCGCFMNNKAMFKSVSCPENKWEIVND